MERKNLIGFIVFAIFLFIIGLLVIHSYGVSPAKSDCEALYNEIENDFIKANFCEQDSDCKVIELGGVHIKFGCFKFINKATDEAELYKKMQNYYIQCNREIDDCAPSPKPVCINKKCVASQK
jgi:hypothetical protein